MRNRFDIQLEQLNQDLISMGALCENAIATAVRYFLEGDKALSKMVKKVEKEINQKERDIEASCLKLLLQQQPVAKDLRLVSAALKMITDMERIGDQACEIAHISRHVNYSKNNSNHVHLAKMADIAVAMVGASIDAFVKKDLDLAKKIQIDDEQVDALFKTIKSDLIKQINEDVGSGEDAIDMLMIAKYLERIGDHSVNISEWVIFSITGLHEVEDEDE